LANTKSAIKMIRVNERKRRRNQPIRSEVKTLVKKARRGVEAGDLDVAKENVRRAESAVDRAANKGVIHKNAAARHKSRLMKRLAKSQQGDAAAS
jgi:small subunit ribosomal protein S20